jgi:hypothetical protein
LIHLGAIGVVLCSYSISVRRADSLPVGYSFTLLHSDGFPMARPPSEGPRLVKREGAFDDLALSKDGGQGPARERFVGSASSSSASSSDE